MVVALDVLPDEFVERLNFPQYMLVGNRLEEEVAEVNIRAVGWRKIPGDGLRLMVSGMTVGRYRCLLPASEQDKGSSEAKQCSGDDAADGNPYSRGN